MKRFALTVLLTLMPASLAAHVAAPHRSEHREFGVSNFTTESGVTLPQARVVYGTYGRLNAARGAP